MSETSSSPRYTGRADFSKKNYTEATWATMSGSRTWVRVGFALFFLAAGLFFLLNAIRHQLSLFSPIVILVMSVLYGLLLPLNVYYIVRKQFKRMEELGKADLQLRFSFTEDEMAVSTNLDDKKDNTPYDRIVRVQETKNLLMVWRRQRMFHFIEKAGLSCPPAELKAFLKEKNPQMKIK